LILYFKIIRYLIFTLIILSACNPNRDRWINRKWHTLTGHYNVYFNGEQKLEDAILQIEKTHINDFTKVLDVYPILTEQSSKAAANLLDDALKKFSATIQLHNVGSYTDNAYFSIAVTRYYKYDFFSALEMFQFVNGKYKDLGYKHITTSWVARCYMGLNKPAEAEAIMGLLLSDKNISKKDLTDVYATAADVNIKLNKYTSAIDNLKQALNGKLTKIKKIRYHFILGQLYALNNNKAQAQYHFTKVIKFTPDYDFEFNANINLVKLINSSDAKNVAKVRRNLKHMANDDKNADYLDQIYYELGKLEMNARNFTKGIEYYKKSANCSTKNRNQKAMSFLALAKHYFTFKAYDNAKAYYDSTVQFLDKQSKDFDNINKTKNVLTDLINNLTVYETEDSLQKLSNLSKTALEQKINNWIAEKKVKDDIAARLAKKQKNIQESLTQNQINAGNVSSNFNPGAFGNAGWYFYNAQLVSIGTADFFSARKWGQRKNEDFWRIEAKEKATNADAQAANTDKTDVDTLIKKDDIKEIKPEENIELLTGNKAKDEWILNVPFTADKKKQSNLKMIEALNNLGKIYYDKLNAVNECIFYFNILQNKFPLSEYEPDAFYYLYKAHSENKETLKSEEQKNALLNTYPEHRYSLLLQNKPQKSVENTAQKELLNLYEKMYNEYTLAQYAEAFKTKQEADAKFPGNTLRAKFELLYAFCLAKYADTEQLKKQLLNITTDFALTEEAKTAQSILNAIDKQDKKTSLLQKDSLAMTIDFDVATNVPHYYVFAIKNEKADFTEYNSKFSDYNEEFASLDNLKCNAMANNEGYQFILVREFVDFKKAHEYYKGVAATRFIELKLKVTEPYLSYIISTANFRKALKEKKMEAFNNFFMAQLKSAIK